MRVGAGDKGRDGGENVAAEVLGTAHWVGALNVGPREASAATRMGMEGVRGTDWEELGQ